MKQKLLILAGLLVVCNLLGWVPEAEMRGARQLTTPAWLAILGRLDSNWVNVAPNPANQTLELPWLKSTNTPVQNDWLYEYIYGCLWGVVNCSVVWNLLDNLLKSNPCLFFFVRYLGVIYIRLPRSKYKASYKIKRFPLRGLLVVFASIWRLEAIWRAINSGVVQGSWFCLSLLHAVARPVSVTLSFAYWPMYASTFNLPIPPSLHIKCIHQTTFTWH